MGNCDFRSTPQTNDKDVNFEQEKYKSKSSGPIVINIEEDNRAPNIEIHKEDNDNNQGHKEITFNNFANNDPSQPAILQQETNEQNKNVEVDVDQVIYVDSKEQNREEENFRGEEENLNHDDSLVFECSANTNVELTNKKKTENFKVEHPLKTHGIDNFKNAFKNKLGKAILEANQ
jgi:hypothetical protein